MGDNPRQIKRTVNVFLLLWNLSQKRKEKLGDRIKPVRLAKVVAIQNVYPALYEVLKTTPACSRELEDYYRAETQPERGQKPAEDESAAESAMRTTPGAGPLRQPGGGAPHPDHAPARNPGVPTSAA